ncbi:MAG: hypothetical protein EOP48_22250 [Sphingobacteriales bacterium]|nr:MAG: hypothetical protein EOP48_22250 [Sphingobacteriales bacterium]
MAKDLSFQQYHNDLFKKIQADIKGSYNPKGKIHYYATEEDFKEGKAAIAKKADDFYRNKLLDDPTKLWEDVRKCVDPSGSQATAIDWTRIANHCGFNIGDLQTEEDWKNLDSMVSTDFNLYDFLLPYTSQEFQYNLKGMAEIFLSVVYLYEFPLYKGPFLIRIREKVYQLQLRIFKKLRQPNDSETNDFCHQWIIDENANADKLAEMIELDKEKMIYVDYNTCRSTLTRYRDYLKEQHQKNKDLSLQSKNGNESEKPSYLGYALMHYYWYKNTQDKSVQINENSYRRLTKEYELKSAKQLWKYAKPMLDEEPKADKHHTSILEYERQYKLILPLLKTRCKPAYEEVEAKLKKLKQSNPNLNF